jgi:hypothetical protein
VLTQLAHVTSAGELRRWFIEWSARDLMATEAIRSDLRAIRKLFLSYLSSAARSLALDYELENCQFGWLRGLRELLKREVFLVAGVQFEPAIRMRDAPSQDRQALRECDPAKKSPALSIRSGLCRRQRTVRYL